MKKKTTARRPSRKSPVKKSNARRCGLCGKKGKLYKTECCGQWICDDEDSYVLFSYAQNSCSRNHGRMTLCGYHHTEEHQGDWRTCPECREDFQTEMYVWYGTNEFNFEKLENPPDYEPTHCNGCGGVIELGVDAYSKGPQGTFCGACTEKRFNERHSR